MTTKTYKNLTDFLRQHKTTAKEGITHTRIGGDGVIPAKYIIPDEEYDTFLNHYYKHIIVDKKPEYLTEVQRKDDTAKLYVDLDFRYDTNIKEKQHTQQQIDDLVSTYLENIIRMKPTNLENFKCYVMEKNNVNCLEDKTKDGLHLLFTVQMNHNAQQLLRKYVLEDIQYVLDELPLINKYEDVLDEGLSRGSNNSIMFGSKKPQDKEAYKVKYVYECIVEDVIVKQLQMDELNGEEMKKDLSVRVSNGLTLQFEEETLKQMEQFNKPKKSKFNKNKKVKSSSSDSTITTDPVKFNYERIEKNLNKISIKKLTDVQSAVGIILMCASTGDDKVFELVDKVMSKAPNYDPEWVKFQWDEYDPVKHSSYVFEYDKQQIDFNPYEITNTSVAKYFVEKYGNDFRFSMDDVYYWTGDIWSCKNSLSYIHSLIGGEVYKELHDFILEEYREDTKPEELSKLLKGIVVLQQRKFRKNTLDDIIDILKIRAGSEKFQFDINEQQRDYLQFKNGCLYLPTGEFRTRTRDDLVSMTLPYNYKQINPALINKVKQIYHKIQPENEQREFLLNWLGYCITGHTKEQVFKGNIGYTASNGKSTEIEIHSLCLPLYTYKLSSSTFDLKQSNTKDKELIKLVEKPVRCALIEEISKGKQDDGTIKDLVDGKKIAIKRLYKSSENYMLHTKLTFTSNHDLNIEGDEGVMRRGMKQDYTSKFINPEDGEEDPERHIYHKDKSLTNMFSECDDYKIAYIQMLMPYVKNYYEKGLVVPKSCRDGFKDMVEEYDDFKSKLFNIVEKCDGERIGKDTLMDAFKAKGFRFSWRYVLGKMKTYGFSYDKRKGYKDDGKNKQGCFMDLCLREEEEYDSDEC